MVENLKIVLHLRGDPRRETTGAVNCIADIVASVAEGRCIDNPSIRIDWLWPLKAEVTDPSVGD